MSSNPAAGPTPRSSVVCGGLEKVMAVVVAVSLAVLLLDIELFVPVKGPPAVVMATYGGEGGGWSVGQGHGPFTQKSGDPAATGAAENTSVTPFVSIVTLTGGQTYLDRNVVQNLMYQNYPHNRLEMLVIDTNPKGPSSTLIYWNTTLSNEADRKANKWPEFRYFYFEPNKDMATGGKRNFLNTQVKGDIVIHVDNDDIAMSNYVQSVVKIFTGAAINKTFPLEHLTSGIDRKKVTDTSGPNITTRCCRDQPDKGPLLRNMILQSAYTQGSFLPDGTSQFVRQNAGGFIGALTSYTVAVAKNCSFRNRQIQEEHLFFNCAMDKYGVHFAKGNEMPGGNSQLLMRISHPLSITNMGYFVERDRWNQLDGEDLIAMYRQIAWWYEFLHESVRPLWITALPVKDRQFYNTGGDVWKAFHRKHNQMFNGGQYPYCRNFVATPGQMWPAAHLKASLVTSASDAKDCCNKCSDAKKANSQCIAWTFLKSIKECQMMTTDPTKMPELVTGNMNNVSSFFEFESAVHQDACKKCASGFSIGK